MHSTSIRTNRRGFSLPELMVVIVIIGLLAGVVTVSVRSYLVKSKQNVAKLEISKMQQALESFYLELDRYPTNEEGIEILAKESDAFPAALLSKLPKDPWGNAYEYLTPGSNDAPYEIICYGADNREGGTGAEKDISSADVETEE
ncbi:MAG: type II secretion system major pseudopilin GspG [Planctomycetaceae bacterium]|nr:type II secretion system major pseudopilin GspG [Planctomycetaceae bacterium]